MIGLFVVREEGGLYEACNPIGWLLSNAPIWGLRLGRTRFIYDTILKAHGMSPWRTRPVDVEHTWAVLDAIWDAWQGRWVSRLERTERGPF